MIQTVTGILQPEVLTFCQCHEHLLLSKGASWRVDPALCMEDYGKSLHELMDYHAAGGSTIVEAQPVGCNRMTRELVQLSRDSGVTIIASTGFHKHCFYPAVHWLHSFSWQQIAGVFIRELTEGMFTDADNHAPTQQIGEKAGIIKTALDKTFTPMYEELFRAAAVAQFATGAPMLIHVEKGSDPVQLFRFLSALGVPAESMIFCHMDRSTPDLQQHKFLLQKGAYLEYDTIGRFKYHSDRQEIDLMQQILRWGFAGQLLFSLDTTALRLKHYTPEGVGLTYILKTFLPLMRESGISAESIDQISRQNCISALRWKPRAHK